MTPASARRFRPTGSFAPTSLAWALGLSLALGGCDGDSAPRPSESGTATDVSPLRRVDTRRVTEIFRRTLEGIQGREAFPGAVAAFILPSGRIGVAATGLADVEEGTLMYPHARFQSGSIGKTFVAAVGLSLVMDGDLELDAPAARWVGDRPWFLALPNHELITVRQLMSHSSGLADHVYDPDFADALASLSQDDPTATLSPEELVAFIHDDEPLFPPGEGYAYTDTGYIILGLVIEAAAGTSYESLLGTRFLTPLGLDSTTPATPRVENRAAGYMAPDNPLGLPPKTVQEGTMVFNPEIEWTGGGLATNPADLVLWARTLYEGQAMAGEYLGELLGSRVPLEPGSEDGYGLGVYIRDTRFGMSYGHGGWFPGYRSLLRYFPDHRVAIAIQVNTDFGVDLNDYLDELTTALLDNLP